jgi:hypothetical protein
VQLVHLDDCHASSVGAGAAARIGRAVIVRAERGGSAGSTERWMLA